MILILKKCEHCGAFEERIFTDSWTGLELCMVCIWPICGQITMSPSSEGDNLEQLLEGN